MVAEAVAEEMSSEPEYLAADETAEADVEPYFDEPLMADERDDEFDADTDYQPAEAPAYAAEQPAYAPASYAAVQPAAYAATAQAAYAPGEAPAAYATPDYAEAPAEIVAETMSWEESGQEEDDPLSEFVVEQELEAELAGLEDDIDLGLDDLVLDDEPVVAASAEQPVILEQPQVTKVAFAPLSAPKAPVEAEEEDPFAMLAAMVRDTPPVAQQPVRSPASASMRFQDLPRSEAPKVSETFSVDDRVSVSEPFLRQSRTSERTGHRHHRCAGDGGGACRRPRYSGPYFRGRSASGHRLRRFRSRTGERVQPAAGRAVCCRAGAGRSTPGLPARICAVPAAADTR